MILCYHFVILSLSKDLFFNTEILHFIQNDKPLARISESVRDCRRRIGILRQQGASIGDGNIRHNYFICAMLPPLELFSIHIPMQMILIVKSSNYSEVFVSSYFGLTQSTKSQDFSYFTQKIGTCQLKSMNSC